MKPEIKKRWIDALKSGDYVQGKEALCDRGDSFCCLGVLCDLYIQDTKNGEWLTYDEDEDGFADETVRFIVRADNNYMFNVVEAEILPMIVAEWAGIPTDKQKVSGRYSSCDIFVPKQEGYNSNRWDIPPDMITLAELNDLGASFEYIADVIERNL